MGRAALTLRRFRMRLSEPWVAAAHTWSQRSAVLVKLEDSDGWGYGEAAPLPGYSDDTLEGCEAALLSLERGAVAGLLQERQPAALLARVAELLPPELPAARFALEAALLDRLGRSRGEPVWHLLAEVLPRAPTPPAAVPLAALLTSSDANAALAAARQHVSRGVRVFKLKIGPRTLSAEQRQTLRALRAAFGGEVGLRVDANRSLEPAGLESSLSELAALRVEFVEEPVSDPSIPELAASPCALALDETLKAMTLEQLAALPRLAALVLKPTVLGGFAACLQWAAWAAEARLGVVVSHTLEGPLGWAACAQLALALRPAMPAGLWPTAEQTSSFSSSLIAGGCLQPLHVAGLGLEP